MISEALVQYAWQAGLFQQHNLHTVHGEVLTILERGLLNRDAGPDFTSAKIRLGHVTWSGNIEIHLRSGDWDRHKHHLDKSYNNTVLHVVLEYDKVVYRQDGTMLPTLLFKEVMDPELEPRYNDLYHNRRLIPCASVLPMMDYVHIVRMMDCALIERLQMKTTRILQDLDAFYGDWNIVLYRLLCRNFGFGSNALPFEELSNRLPWTVLSKNRNQLFILETLIFGVAGHLEPEEGDSYFLELRREWLFIKHKYALQSMDNSSWKIKSSRPANFPSLRLAQLAALLNGTQDLFQKLLKSHDINDIKSIFSFRTSEYWQGHYRFGVHTSKKHNLWSDMTFQLVIINTAIPLIFAYGLQTGLEEVKKRALHWLQQLPPEQNSFTRDWRAVGIDPESAFESQALIHQKRYYCNPKRCTACEIGHHILSGKINLNDNS